MRRRSSDRQWPAPSRRRGGCIVIPHAEFAVPTLARALEALLTATQRLADMAAAAHAAGRPDAAARLADLVNRK